MWSIACYSHLSPLRQEGRNNTGTICFNIILPTRDMRLHSGLNEFHTFFMTRSTWFFSWTVFVISRLVFFLIRRQVYFEGTKKPACNYAENVLSDWCLHGVYVWQKLWKKNISSWVFIWIKFKFLLASLSALQHFGFFWTPAAKATQLQELTGHFRPRLSPDSKNMAFAKKWKLHSSPRYNPAYTV